MIKNFDPHFVVKGKKGSYVVQVVDEEKDAMRVIIPGSSMAGVSIGDFSESLDFEDDPEELTEKRLLAILERKEERKGQEFVAFIGPFGPYIKLGNEARSVQVVEDFLNLTVSDCIEKFKEKKTWNKRAPIAQWPDEKWGNIQLLSGKFGHYLTSTKVKINASLSTGDVPEELTKERAIELLEEAELKKLEAD